MKAASEPDLVELRQGDVYSPPLAEHEWETFDLAHARFLLEHLHDPLAAVRSMVRALRPGGRIILADDDHDLLCVRLAGTAWVSGALAGIHAELELPAEWY